MASYALLEEAKIIASLSLDLANLKNDYHKLSNLETFQKLITEKCRIKVRNVIINTRSINADAFIIGHTANGIIGTGILGDTGTGTGAWGEWCRRRWDWDNYDRLSAGTYDDNVSIEDGLLTLK